MVDDGFGFGCKYVEFIGGMLFFVEVCEDGCMKGFVWEWIIIIVVYDEYGYCIRIDLVLLCLGFGYVGIF